MNTTRKLLAIAICTALAGAAVAQTGASPAAADRGAGTTGGPGMASPAAPGGTAPGMAAPTSPAVAATHELKAARLSKLDGLNIYDSNSKKIGEIQDLVVDPASGRVLHALVSMGGVLGIGDKQYEVPTKQLRIFSRAVDDTVPVKAELTALQESLTAAKNLEKDSPHLMGSKLVGTDVNDSSGKEAGEIKDIIVDLQTGEAKHVLIEFDDSWTRDDKLFAFPMSELKRGKDGRDLVLSVTKESLGTIPSIESSRLDKVDLSGSSWLQTTGVSAGTSAGASGGASGTAAPGAAAPGAGSSPKN